MTAPAPAAGPLFAGPRDVDGNGASAQIFAVQGVDGFLRLLGRAHGHEAESARPTRGTIHHQVGFHHRAVRRKGILKIVFRNVETKVPYKQFCTHL